jgi:hypothetical protein
MTQLLNSLNTDGRFKGPQGVKGEKGDTGNIGPTGATGSFDPNVNYTFNHPITIKKSSNDRPIQFIGTVPGNYSVLEIDQDGNSGDYLIFSSKSNAGGTNLILQPQNWAKNVYIGYNPNNYQNDGTKSPPDNAKLAVNGEINSSFGYGINNNSYKFKFP